MIQEILELAKATLKSLEAANATDDMLALLCAYFAEASPEPTARLLVSLQQIRESESIERTVAFDALSRRLEKALSGDPSWHFLSLTKPTPATREELRACLHLIQGGKAQQPD